MKSILRLTVAVPAIVATLILPVKANAPPPPTGSSSTSNAAPAAHHHVLHLGPLAGVIGFIADVGVFMWRVWDMGETQHREFTSCEAISHFTFPLRVCSDNRQTYALARKAAACKKTGKCGNFDFDAANYRAYHPK